MSRPIVTAIWDDVPHLDPAAKAELLASIPPHQRAARARGVPTLGTGAIYPVPEEDISVAPFAIPEHWPRSYGLDVGWNRTAAVWAATDRDAQVTYLYAEHYRGQAEPSVHADAIRARGAWIPGAIDPAARGRGQTDGRALLDAYRDLGLDLTPADNAVESGLHKIWQMLSGGRLKVFSTLAQWFAEYRLYRRDDHGRIVKDRDHLMDATRYLAMTGLDRARATPAETPARPARPSRGRNGGEDWLGL